MVYLSCENQGVIGARKSLIGIAEQPPTPGSNVSSTNPGVVSVYIRVRSMPLEIIEVAALFGMVAAQRRLTQVELSCPGGVMGL